MKILSSLLLAATALSGCAAVAVGAAGVLVAQEVLPNNTYVAQVALDSRKTWASVKSTLSHMSLDPIETDEDLKEATARYDEATVKVQVETFDVGKSTIRVHARKYGVTSSEIAEVTLARILQDLDG